MKTRLEFLENARANNTKWTEIDINILLGQAYLYSFETDNELPNFSEVVWQNQIEEILADCKRYGITEFTISSTFSSLINVVARFEELGAKLDGLVKINSIHRDWINGGKEIIPAFKMSI